MSAEIGELLLQEVAPRIRSAVPYCVRTVGCEDHEEIRFLATFHGCIEKVC